ncbi:hypothetical protein E2C01_048613 [Portunus trituberculatus]|uniref:Uncharacterized protein n=1 Tax=Portunus trituberculatus TaxID=210409 RepID=A0A5B7GAN9_PORTR|nr:hypothetical protein [Portunus trituberculatus]
MGSSSVLVPQSLCNVALEKKEKKLLPPEKLSQDKITFSDTHFWKGNAIVFTSTITTTTATTTTTTTTTTTITTTFSTFIYDSRFWVF